MKRHNLMASFMAAALLFTAVPAIPAYAAPYQKTNGVYELADGTPVHGVFARGIDVSHWKQNIDWNAVAADDVEFVMLGTRYNNDVDPYFRINAEGAYNAGIQLGAYIYSYATTTDMAVAEADFVLDLIKDYPISYPVAFDMEASVQSTLSPSQLADIINAFCERIEEAGYYPILYANDHWLANKIDMSQVDYDVWVARYGKMHEYSNPVMWQAASTGTVSGIQGDVDIDFQYVDLSSKIPANLWRTIGDKTYYYQNYVMQKDNWIQDQSRWYYIDSDGQAYKGWLEQDNIYYYLDPGTGRMATGWQNVENSGNWYYFNESGHMQTGWTQVNSAWYYLSSSGVMQTGWQTVDGTSYFLKDSGEMVTGWKQLNQQWYFFSPSGAMKTGWINPDGSWYYLNESGHMQTSWLNLNGSWYYLNSSGQMETGLITVDGKQYYLDGAAGGIMVSNTTIHIGDSDYQAASDGSLTKIEPVENAEAGALDGSDGSNTSADNGSGEVPAENQDSQNNSGQSSSSPDSSAGPGAML